MTVRNSSVVRFEYTLKVGDTILEQTAGKPKTVLMGHTHGLPPGLESALIGHAAGETFQFQLDNGYGEFVPDKIQTVPKSAFPDADTLDIGNQFYSKGDNGEPVAARIIAISGGDVTIDSNPEHAGKTLNYTITIHSVRDADKEELEHGHVHGEGGVTHGH
jgi:FKBP-type peptidyl-prolyl cis-trans isomerase SlyD